MRLVHRSGRLTDEHLIEHEVQQVLIRTKQFHELLTLDLRELFDFLRRSGLNNPQVSVQELLLFWRLLKGFVFKTHQFLTKAFSLGVDAV